VARTKTTFVQNKAVLIGSALAVILLIAGVLLAMNYQKQLFSDPLVVSVNGEAVYAQDVWSIYNRLPADMQQQYSPESILEQIIDKMLIMQYAQRQGVVITQERLDEAIDVRMTFYGTTREELRQLLEAQGESMEEFEQGMRDELVLEVFVSTVLLPSITVSDSEVQAYYETRIHEFQAGTGQMRVRHILIESEQEANNLRQEIIRGAEFSSLATAYSLDSAPRGGDLGFISADSALVEPFKSTALSLAVGEVSQPVQTQFGWHIIRREEDIISLREARSIISDRLREQKAQQRFATLQTELREQAVIKYHRGADDILSA